MRTSNQEHGWIHGLESANIGSTQPIGLSLGYDRHPDHWTPAFDEMVRPLALNPDKLTHLPVGLSDRQLASDKLCLHFECFSQTQRDHRRKPVECALLVVTRSALPPLLRAQLDALQVDLRLPGPLQAPGTIDDRSNRMRAAWGKNGFAVAVRGAQDIDMLRQLRERFAEADIALGSLRLPEFAVTSNAIVVPSRLNPKALEAVRAADLDAIQLHEAATQTGIEAELRKAGRRWYALSAGWRDKAHNQVHFFINPQDQKNHNHGWFTPGELRRWIRNEGPVMADTELNELERLGGPFREFRFKLLGAMSQAGANQVRHPRLAWLNGAQKLLGQEMALRQPSGAVIDRWESLDDLAQKYLGQPVDVNELIRVSRAQKALREINAKRPSMSAAHP